MGVAVEIGCMHSLIYRLLYILLYVHLIVGFTHTLAYKNHDFLLFLLSKAVLCTRPVLVLI